ncbi:MAG: glutathione S-transferase [Alphaproteobacteria bacterium]|nr:glutathione S-transferase [Alphaproteobacteria bacterium]
MRLRYSPASPFVRKVVVAAMETGLDGRIERIATDPMKRKDRDGAPNPLGKVPSLETDDGIEIYDSPVIVEYLDHVAGGNRLIPASGRARWDALRRQALADGILENTILVFIETLRKPDRRSENWIAHNRRVIARAIDALEAEAAGLGEAADIGHLTVAIALDFVDQHFPDQDWRATHPTLARWFDRYRTRLSLAATRLEPASAPG